MSEVKLPRLTIISENGRGAEFILKKPKYSCGRIDSNDIVLNDASVSSNHCEFIKKGNSYIVSDLNSTNGVIFNGVLQKEKVLNENDIIKIGVVELLYNAVALPVEENIQISQVKPKVKTGIDLDVFEKENVAERMKNISPFANSESKDLKNRLPLIILTTAIVLLALIVLGLLAWLFTVFVL